MLSDCVSRPQGMAEELYIESKHCDNITFWDEFGLSALTTD